MSRTSPDSLKPCGGVIQLPVFGDCFQEFNTSSISQSVWTNTTRVTDWHDISTWTADGITPYERPYSSRDITCFGDRIPGGDDCAAIINAFGVGNPSEDLPTISCSVLNCTSSDTTVNQSYLHNCFHKTTQSVNMSLCKHVGYKNLVARKIWQGRTAFTCRDEDTFDNHGNWDSFDYCGQASDCCWHGYDQFPDPNKYRTVAANSTVTAVHVEVSTNYTIVATAQATCSIDRYSGARTSSESSSSAVTAGSTPQPLGPYADYALLTTGIANSWATIIMDSYTGHYINMTSGHGDPIVTAHSANSYTLTWDFGGGDGATLFIDMTAFSMTFACSAGSFIGSDSISCTATTLHRDYTYHEEHPSAGLEDATFTEVTDCTLSDLYTSDMVMSDWMDLIKNYYDISNEITYPWRYRSFENNTNSPMVGRDEIYASVVVLSSGPDTSLTYNGSVVGTPNKAASTAPFWDGKWLAYQNCPPINLRGYGGWSGQSGVPNAATKWTDMLQAQQIPQGAFLSYNNPVLIGGIDAEIYGHWQGYNWARPCGATDRFMLSGSANCLSSVSSSGKIVLLDPLSFPNNIIGTMTSSIWGADAGTNGIWITNCDSSGTCSLVKQIISGSDMPLGQVGIYGYSSDTSFGHGMIGQNRWVTNTPPFCGRVDITKLTQTTPVTMSLMEPQQGFIPGDKITIKGCSGSLEFNGHTYTVKSLGSPYTDFVLSGSVSSSNAYLGGGYIEMPFPPGAIDWKWNSNASRGNFVIGWYDNSTNLRELGEYSRLQSQSGSNAGAGTTCALSSPTCPSTPVIPLPVTATPTYTQSCMPGNPCSPNVIAIYPSGSIHSFKQVNVHPFKMNMVLDNRYGNYWSSWIIQSIPDPLYVKTPCPCRENLPCDSEDPPLGYDCFSSNWLWLNDGGNCQGIQYPICDGMGGLLLVGEDFYADADRYEAVVNIPVGAPPLPSGIDLKQSMTIPSPGYWWASPWYDTLVKENCICNSGRFSQFYQSNGFSCADMDISLT